MRWARVRNGNAISFAIVEHSRIELVEGTPFDSHTRTGRYEALGEVELLPPVVPPTMYAVGWNYASHRTEAAARAGRDAAVPERPNFGYRTVNALIGDGRDIVLPHDSSGSAQYEGELVVVMGKQAKHVSEIDALSYVLGYTIGNDVTERSWQNEDRSLWRSKNIDNFKPMGPWIETDVALPDLVTRVWLNGKTVAEFQTNTMLFGVARCISILTRGSTLYPGDVIWMGTDAPTLDMKPGDAVEVEIQGIGTLRNRVVAESPS